MSAQIIKALESRARSLREQNKADAFQPDEDGFQYPRMWLRGQLADEFEALAREAQGIPEPGPDGS